MQAWREITNRVDSAANPRTRPIPDSMRSRMGRPPSAGAIEEVLRTPEGKPPEKIDPNQIGQGGTP